MLINDIKEKIKVALVSKNEMEKNLLRLVLGESQQKNLSTDEEVTKIIRKIVEANTETLKVVLSQNPGLDVQSHNLTRENDFLATLIPAQWDEAKLMEFLFNFNVELKERNEGMAMKFAMFELKNAKAVVDGKLVKAVIAKIRS